MKRAKRVRPFRNVAERTGLEPATSGVTGRHSNQLNYRSFISFRGMNGCSTTEPQLPFRFVRPFHPADVNRHHIGVRIYGLVGAESLELPTFAL